MTLELLRQLETPGRGYKGGVVSIERLRDLQEEIEKPYRQGLLDDGFYQERLTVFTFSPPDSLPEARSLIVVAVPEPQTRFTFTWNGTPVPVTLPPTFGPEQQIGKRVTDVLAEVLAPAGYRVAQAVLPKKPLAVHSGLAAYGRNNLCYVPGMGSFHRLLAFYSDLPCPQDKWQEPEMMERCQTCRACLHNCPTGAISDERFLLHAERCITFHNEKPGDVPFPAWLDPRDHNCLVGCLRCQSVCPENRNGEALAWVEEGAEFSSEETALLVEGIPLDRLPAATVKKLEQWGIVDLLDVLPRNLKALFEVYTANTPEPAGG